jgi:O-antigen/teichoic acid export membrane protein
MIAFINRSLEGFGIQEFKLTGDHITQISWLGWGQFASLFLSLISIKLTTTIGPSEYGSFVLATSIGGFLTLSFFGPMEQGFVRYYFEFTKSDEEKSAYLISILRMIKASFLILSILAVVIITVAVVQYNQSLIFWGSAGILIIISAIANPFNGLLNAMKLRKEISIIQTMEKLCIVIFLVIATFVIALNASIVMICVFSATGIFLVVRVSLFKKQSSIIPSREIMNRVKVDSLKKIMIYSLPFILWGWLSWFQFNGERWVVNTLVSTSEAGKYGLAVSLVNNSIVLAYGVFIQFILPTIYTKFSSETISERIKGYSIIKLASSVTVVLFLIFGIFLFLAGDSIVHIISSKEFIIHSSFFLFLTIGIGFFYVGQTLAIVGLALQKPEAYLIPKIGSAVISMAGYIIGCYWFGIYGIAYAACVANAFYLLSIYIVNARLLKNL